MMSSSFVTSSSLCGVLTTWTTATDGGGTTGSGVGTFDDGGTTSDGVALAPKLGDHTLAEGLNTNSLAFGFMLDRRN